MKINDFLKIITVTGCFMLGVCTTGQVEVKKTPSAENAYLEAYRIFQETDYMRSAELFEKIDLARERALTWKRSRVSDFGPSTPLLKCPNLNFPRSYFCLVPPGFEDPCDPEK